MTQHPRLPPDTQPLVRQRVQEASARGLLASKVTMLALAWESDPVVQEIRRVMRQLPALGRQRSEETLKLFALLDRSAELLKAELLKGIDAETRRPIYAEFEQAVCQIFPTREVAEVESVHAMLAKPAYATIYFTEGMACVRQKWQLATMPRDKVRFIERCLDSDKGYSKTLRTIPAWLPASQIAFSTIVAEWLDGETNTSVFTNEPTHGTPMSRREQIRSAYTGPLEDRPDESGLRTLWVGLLQQLSEEKDFGLRKEPLRTLVAQCACDLIRALRGVLPDAHVKVLELNGGGFEAVYATLNKPEEGADIEFTIASKKREAANLAVWIRHLDHALPALKRARFGADAGTPHSVADQLNAITGDPALVKTPNDIDLRKLKAHVASKARDALGGAEVDLTTTDPKRLDLARLVPQVRAQLEQRRLELVAAAAQLEKEKKPVLRRYPMAQ